MYEPGTLIGGKYHLEEQIGEGGMAIVWRATHTTLGSPVAVKFVSIVGADVDDRRERFLREAQLAASVRHRSVVDILDFGQMPDGQPYMVMELLVGETFGDRLCREPRLDVDEIVRIFDGVLGGLGAIHAMGIVHRDLKPDNIFLLQDADGMRPKLMDFGISRASSRASERPPSLSGQRPLTQAGIVLGTPDYMSPEQARGLPDVGSRADIFSMGVLLYEALGRRVPFEGIGTADLLMKIITEEPVPLTELGVDDALAGVVETAMAKDPEHRFREASAMRVALRKAGHGTLADVTGITDLHRIEAELLGKNRGRPWLRGALALVALLGFAGLAFAVTNRLSGSEPPADPSTSGAIAPALAVDRPVVEDPAVTDPGASDRAQADIEPDIDPSMDDVVMIGIEFSGVPEGAEVRVDGVLMEGAVSIPRDEAAHEIEIRAEGYERWVAEQIADEDVRLEVEMRRRSSSSGMRRPRGMMRGQMMDQGRIIRALDF